MTLLDIATIAAVLALAITLLWLAWVCAVARPIVHGTPEYAAWVATREEEAAQ